jgi:phage shock protein E
MHDFLPWLIPIVLVTALLVFKRLGQVSSDEARKLVSAGATLVDVRTAAEFAGGHIPGAINIPVGDLAGRVDALGNKDEPKVVYCASGTRSALARSMLKGRGFSRVYNLGSMSRW